jgi:hypothetical protein
MTKKIQPTLDDTALRFLGNKREEIRVMEGQEAKATRLEEQRERFLLTESCEYGNSLVLMATGHRHLTPEQLAWGFTLSLLCLRADYPEGSDRFDDLADQAGKDLHLPVTTYDEETIATIRKTLQPLVKEKEYEAAKFAEVIAKYIEMTKRRGELSNPQAAYGLGRAFHNLRSTFPADKGGTVAFDEYAKHAGMYYDVNKLGR